METRTKVFNGKRLSLLRFLKGWSLQEVADHLGVGKQTVSKYESGQITPPLVIVVGMSELFSVPLDYWTSTYVQIDFSDNDMSIEILKQAHFKKF